MTPQLRRMAFFSLSPAVMILLACIWGGGWSLLSLIWMIGVIAALDHGLALEIPPGARDGALRAANGLSCALVAAHVTVLGGVIASVTNGHLHMLSASALVIAAGLYLGQVSNVNAHELIHRPGRGLRRLGRWVYISLLFGHHASAHLLVHHIHVATDHDPNSARRGESYWRFVRRAWVGSFHAGLAAENRRHTSPWFHPYTEYIAGAALCITVVLALFGPWGMVLYLWLCAHAVGQLMMSDYVQHYGLRRRIMANGRPEPVGPMHSWDSRHRASSAMLLNATRHSDHHAHPMRPYPQLELPAQGMVLPRSLPVMGMIALVPRLWRARMDPLLPDQN